VATSCGHGWAWRREVPRDVAEPLVSGNGGNDPDPSVPVIGHRVGYTGLSGPAWRRIPASRRCQPELCAVAPCRLLSAAGLVAQARWWPWAPGPGAAAAPAVSVVPCGRLRRTGGRMYRGEPGGLRRADQASSSAAAVATERCTAARARAPRTARPGLPRCAGPRWHSNTGAARPGRRDRRQLTGRAWSRAVLPRLWGSKMTSSNPSR